MSIEFSNGNENKNKYKNNINLKIGEFTEQHPGPKNNKLKLFDLSKQTVFHTYNPDYSIKLSVTYGVLSKLVHLYSIGFIANTTYRYFNIINNLNQLGFIKSVDGNTLYSFTIFNNRFRLANILLNNNEVINNTVFLTNEFKNKNIKPALILKNNTDLKLFLKDNLPIYDFETKHNVNFIKKFLMFRIPVNVHCLSTKDYGMVNYNNYNHVFKFENIKTNVIDMAIQRILVPKWFSGMSVGYTIGIVTYTQINYLFNLFLK